jgi:hypothetical protein
LPEFSIILFRSKVIQEFHAFAAVKKFFQLLGANMTPKIVFANLDTPKAFLEKICVDWGIMVQVAIPVRAVGVRKKKKQGKHAFLG